MTNSYSSCRRFALSSVLLLGSAVALTGPVWAYQQAPMLDPLVESGALPPVDERLPAEPAVIEPLESVGKYGGVMKRALTGASGDHNTILRIVAPQSFVRWNPDYTDVVPNVAESWEISDDAREYTFHLRPGIKWSDGEPMTTEDIQFFVEDLLGSDFYGSPPSQFVSGGEIVKIDVIDDYTIKFIFKEPNGLFLFDLASPYGAPPVLWAKHYCSQFHPKYNENIDQLMAEFSQDNWVELFKFRCGTREKGDRWYNPEKPVIEPWVIKEPYTGGATRVVLERNPYFWQVDPEGNQLPYIDRIEYSIVGGTEGVLLEAIGGNIDMQVQNLQEIQNRPLLLENAEKSGYRMIDTVPVGAGSAVIFPNLAHKDPKMRELLNTKDFRIALSHAIDREEIIDLIFLGQGEPWQIGPPEGHALYNETLAKQYTEFDPEAANQMLDELGFDERGSDGFRLDHDGNRISLFVEYNSRDTVMSDIMELVVQYWRDVGIEAKIEAVDNNFFQARNANWDDTIQISGADNGGTEAIWRPIMYVPMEDDSRWGVPWAFWYLSGGTEGEEPPQYVKDRFAAYDKVRASQPGQGQEELMREVLDMTAEAFEVIGISTPLPGQGIVKNGLKNVPDQMPYGFFYLVPQPTMPATYYWDDASGRRG